jgi:hypothetical protein
VASDELLLTRSLIDTFHEAERHLQILYDNHATGFEDAMNPPDEVVWAQSALDHCVEKAFRDTEMLAEKMNLPQAARKISRARKSIDNIGDINILEEAFTFYSPPLEVARGYFNSLRILTQGRDLDGIEVFENILKSAGKIVKSRGLTPINEKQVRDVLREVLGFAFPGVVREMTIEKSLKNYYPDIGIEPLMAAAEVKFADTEQEAKSAIDGIYTDMKGYSGHDKWRSFFGVIYMTDQFFTQEDMEREFELVRAELSWKPIVVVGPGARKKAAR